MGAVIRAMKTEKMLEWCLKRGEIKKRKHRGLREIEPNLEEVKEHLKKADHNLNFMIKVHELDVDDWIFPVAFYSVYHSCLAVLYYFGYESQNQECTFTVVEHLIKQNKIKISLVELNQIRKLGEPEQDVKSLREEFQYGTKVKANKVLVESTVEFVESFVNKVKGLLLTLIGEI